MSVNIEWIFMIFSNGINDRGKHAVSKQECYMLQLGGSNYSK